MGDIDYDGDETFEPAPMFRTCVCGTVLVGTSTDADCVNCRITAIERENAELRGAITASTGHSPLFVLGTLARAECAETELRIVLGKTSVAMDEAQARIRELKSSLSALAREAGELVEALPQCDNGARENRPATRSFGRDLPRYCDDCGTGRPYTSRDVPEYPRAAPLRALVARLAALKATEPKEPQ